MGIVLRRNKVVGVGAVALTLGVALSACGTTEDSDGGSDAGGGDCSAKIAFLGPTTGDYANLGINIINGAKLALDEYEGDCEVEIEEYDSQGDPEQAKPHALEIAKDEDIIGVLGPTFSGESDATGPTFAEVGLVTVSGSATNPDLTTNGWETFHRIIGTDALQAPAAATFMTETLGAEGVMVVDDASEYGVGLAEGIKEALGDAVVETDTVQQKQDDFSATVTKAKSSGADVLYYAGYYAEAGKLAKQLSQGGFEGTFVSGDGSLDPGFIESAGSAADGAYLTCPCVWGTGDWAANYEELIGQAPGTYSTEGYDVMNVFLDGLDEGNTDRESMLEWVNGYDAEGFTKHISFDENGDIEESSVFSYEVKGGEIQAGVPIE